MGTRSILQIAQDVASETGLIRPQTLFGFQEGDETAVQLKRAIEWVCRYLQRHYAFVEAVPGSVGVTTANARLGMVFQSDADIAWVPDEILHLGALWRIEHGDRIEDPTDMKDFDRAVTEWIWAQPRSGKRYRTIDAGMPTQRPITNVEAPSGLLWITTGGGRS